MNLRENERGELVVFEAQDGTIRLDVRLDAETVWLSQQQISELFGRERSVVTKHIRNAFEEGELDASATCAKFAQVRSEGDRSVSRVVEHYNLDVILSVGYRVRSKRGTQFRIWASGVLREHLLRGYTLQRERFESNARELEAALELVRATAERSVLSPDEGRGLVEVIAKYAQTFLLLQRYDEGLLAEPRGAPGGTLPTLAAAHAAIAQLKQDLAARGEATELFGLENEQGLASLLGNLSQSVLGKPAYPTLESKAAHLLYFVIKDHPFCDGNKRIGAFLFVEFLHRNRRLLCRGQPLLNDLGLAALALLVAESPPRAKESMIRLVMNMLAAPGAEHP